MQYDIFDPKYIILHYITLFLIYFDLMYLGSVQGGILLLLSAVIPWDLKMFLKLLPELMSQLSSMLCSGVISDLFFRFPVIFLWCKPIPIIPRTGTGSENRVMAVLEFFRGTEDEKTFACTRNYMKNKGYYKTIRICLTRKKNLTGNYWKWWNINECCVLN